MGEVDPRLRATAQAALEVAREREELLQKIRFATGRSDLEEREIRESLESVLKPSLVHHRVDGENDGLAAREEA